MATYRSLGYDSFIIRSIRSGLFPHEGEDEAAIISNYGDLGFNYSLTRRDLVLPGFSAFETRSMFPDGSISYQQLSSNVGIAMHWKWIDDEAPTSGVTESGWISPTSFTDPNSKWNNEANAYSSDDSYADVTVDYSGAYRIYYKGLDFSSISDAATITGAEVRVDGYRALKLPYLNRGSLSIGQGSHGIGVERYPFRDWPTGEGTISSGGDGDTWGIALTPAYIKDATFSIGVHASGPLTGTTEGYVDWVRIKIYYTT